MLTVVDDDLTPNSLEEQELPDEGMRDDQEDWPRSNDLGDEHRLIDRE
jgi:hypothetical protein